MKVKTTITTKTNPAKITKKTLIDENGVEFATFTGTQTTGSCNVRSLILNQKVWAANQEAAEKARSAFADEVSSILEADENTEENEEEV